MSEDQHTHETHSPIQEAEPQAAEVRVGGPAPAVASSFRDPAHLTPTALLALQRTRGNLYVQRLLDSRSTLQRDASSRTERRRRGRRAASGFEEELAEDNGNLQDVMDMMGEVNLNALRHNDDFCDRMRERLSDEQFLLLAAGMVLNSSYVPGARDEALRIIRIQLGDAAVARRLLDRDLEAVIVPRDQQMTELDEFRSLRNQQTFDGRWWAHVRGVGNVRVGSRVYVAITEENLLGGAPDPGVFDAVPGTRVPAETPQGGYTEGYSTTTHEFAHGIHEQGLSRQDERTIERAYEAKARETNAAPALFENRWVDGPRVSPYAPADRAATGETDAQWQTHVGGLSRRQRKAHECYAAQNEYEYFAQLSNAYLGTNTGIEPTTLQPRNNGRGWVESNEPDEMLALLDRLYRNQTVNEVEASGALSAGGRRTNPLPPPPPATESVPEEGTTPATESVPAEGTTPATETVPEEGTAPATESVPAEGTAPEREVVP
ncbi:MAG: hypothetical protein JXA09_07795 [Anaerolineae bacterium]|nr:hypothetical protein [Anaerolineae bacterium]